MADDIQIPASGKFAPHPATTCAARCVDVIDPGPVITRNFKDKDGNLQPPKLVQKVTLLYQSGKVNPETQRLYEVSVEFTQSMADNANLRKFLVGWFGGYEAIPEEAKKGKLACLTGHPALITVAHRTSQKGNTYAIIPSICPIPEGMTAPKLPAYTRAPYWAERKAERKKEADAFLKQDTPEAQKFAKPIPAELATDFEQVPPALEDAEDDGIPF